MLDPSPSSYSHCPRVALAQETKSGLILALLLGRSPSLFRAVLPTPPPERDLSTVVDYRGEPSSTALSIMLWLSFLYSSRSDSENLGRCFYAYFCLLILTSPRYFLAVAPIPITPDARYCNVTVTYTEYYYYYVDITECLVSLRNRKRLAGLVPCLSGPASYPENPWTTVALHRSVSRCKAGVSTTNSRYNAYSVHDYAKHGTAFAQVKNFFSMYHTICLVLPVTTHS